MDPDACLEEIRDLVGGADKACSPEERESRFDRLVDLIDGLDTWMSRSGCLPTSWATGRSEPAQREAELTDRDEGLGDRDPWSGWEGR